MFGKTSAVTPAVKKSKRVIKNTGRRSRTKGHSFEREVAAAFRLVFPEARRQLEYHVKDALGVDLQETGPYRIQCKRLKKYASIAAINEVVSTPPHVRILVTRGDNTETMAVLPLTELIRLIKADQLWWE